jgi:uncharacterized membrane protein
MLWLALAGLGASAVATWVHWQLVARPGYTSFCDINATVSCTEAYLSRYGSFAGIPVALGGVFWFAFVTILLVAGGRAVGTFRENVPGYVFAASTLALAAVLYLAYASFFVLKAFCVLCVITYVAVAGIFIVSGGATSIAMNTLPRRAWRDLRSLVATPAALFVALIFVAGAGTSVALFPHEATEGGEAQAPPEKVITDQVRSEFERWFLAQPRVNLPVDREGAKVVVVKFNDYQCPPCRHTYMEYKSVFAKYEASDPGAVKVVTKDYPLEPECNFNVPSAVHPTACESAVAVRLAREKGRAHEMEEWLFQNQARLNENPSAAPQAVRDAVRQVAGVQDFDARYASTLKDVQVDISLGGSLQVSSTPTFFVNGRMIKGGLPPQLMDQAIRLAMKDPPQ